MARKSHTPQEKPPELTESEKLAAKLARRSTEEDTLAVESYIRHASALVKKWGRRRGIPKKLYEDPVSSLRIYNDLRDDDRSSKIEVDKTNRPNKNQPYIAEVSLSAATIIATMLIPLVIVRLRSKTDEISERDARSALLDIQEIKGKLGNTKIEDEVIGLMQDVLKIRSLNLDEITDENKIADFLSIFPKVPGHSKTGNLAPEAAKIHLVLRAALLDDIIGHRSNLTPADIQRHVDSTQKVFIPLAALWRLRAHDENNMDLAATLDAIKVKFKDQILQIRNPEGYKRTQDLIIAIVKKAAPERKQHLIDTIREAKALVLGDIAEQLHGLLPLELQDVCKVQARIKSVASTFEELEKHRDALKKQGINIDKINYSKDEELKKVLEKLRDVMGFRVIMKVGTSSSDAEGVVWGMEAARINKLHWALSQNIISSGKFEFEPGRKKDLYDADERRAFFEKKKREDNGYVSVQNGLLFGWIPFEIQLRSERAHNDAELGYASHDRFKGIPITATEMPADEVPVYTEQGFALAKPGGTLADFLVNAFKNAPDPTLVFSAENKLIRTMHLFDPAAIPPPNKGLATPLLPADTIWIDRNVRHRPEMLHDPEHRHAMIKACAFFSSKKFLEDLDRGLTENETNASRPGSAQNEPNGYKPQL